LGIGAPQPVATTIPCHRCRADIEVICIHCATGTVADEPLTEFTDGPFGTGLCRSLSDPWQAAVAAVA
jgi:hypothetical protein